MKRIIVICTVLCLLCATFFIFARTQAFSVPEGGFPDANFNNNYDLSADFWAFKDGIFYLKDGFYNMGVYWSADGKSKKLFEESDFSGNPTGPVTIQDTFVWDSYLYFESHDEERSTIYRYDLNAHTYAPVCEIPHPYRWVVVDGSLIYREHPAHDAEKRSPLWIYHFEDGSTQQICPHVEEFGIVGGQLRYITNDGNYNLYHYTENASSLLGTFPSEFDYPYHLFNFTHDAVVMYGYGKDAPALLVYSLSSDRSVVYPLPANTHQFVAYDRYAFFVVYDRSDLSTDENSGIYRMSLSDGSYELVEKGANQDTKIHVASDDTIYIIQSQLGFLSRHQRHVYFLNCTTGNKVKITTL